MKRLRTRPHGASASPPSPGAVFDSMDAERRHRKDRLAGALQIFERLGYSKGVAGHITARDPERLDHFWVNPSGMSCRHVRVSGSLW